MKVSWNKEQRERAKASGQYLVMLAIDGRCAKIDGQLSFGGPVPESTAKKVEALMLEIMRENVQRKE